jgi:ribosomal protein S18 acetylase RimI-like enzyme
VPHIAYEFLSEAPEEEIIELYRAAGWWKDDPSYRATLGTMIRGSFCFLVARDVAKARIVGMGRAISDGVGDAYLQDITVLPAWRRKGIGREMVRRLTSFCVEQGLTWIALVAEPGTQAFYESVGYQALVGYQPMRFYGGTARPDGARR